MRILNRNYAFLVIQCHTAQASESFFHLEMSFHLASGRQRTASALKYHTGYKCKGQMKLYEYISKFLLSYDVALFYTLDNESLGLLN